MADEFTKIKASIYSALEDEIMQKGIQRGMDSFYQNISLNLAREDVEKIRFEVESIKRESLKNIDELCKKLKESAERNGVDVYFANTKQDALDRVKKITEDCRLIVKSKSMVAEEIGLRGYLESVGKEVWETDTGEFLLQLHGGKPAQMVAPSLHLPREEVAKILSSFFKKDFQKDDLQSMVASVRSFLREKIISADAGITGANAISAEEGTVVTVENEGNVRLTMTMPAKHIVLSSIEKIVPTTLDAVKVSLAQSYFAGYTKPTYISLTSTASGTGDIEKVLIRPAQGSKEMHLLILDNGRKDALSSSYADLLRCIKCGACQLVCPTYYVAGPAWGGKVYTSAIGLIWTAITEDIEEAKNLSHYCLGCDACNEVCPVSIDISGMISILKEESFRGL